MKFTKRFAGSYYATTKTGEGITIQSMSQYTWETDQDSEGNKWVLTFDNDWDNDRQLRAKTKAALVEYATKYL